MIGKKLKYLIKTTKRKQIDLAKHLGISPSRLSNYLSDKREPDFEMLAEMARYLGVDLNYFSDFDFGAKKSSDKKGVLPLIVKEDSAPYEAEIKSNVIRVPLTPINAKKRGINTSSIPLSALFLNGVSEPEKNVTVFEVNGYTPASIAAEEDYLICVKACSAELKDGDCLFENGRNAKFYKYYKHDKSTILINEDNRKEHILINDESEIGNYFKILWVISKI